MGGVHAYLIVCSPAIRGQRPIDLPDLNSSMTSLARAFAGAIGSDMI